MWDTGAGGYILYNMQVSIKYMGCTCSLIIRFPGYTFDKNMVQRAILAICCLYSSKNMGLSTGYGKLQVKF